MQFTPASPATTASGALNARTLTAAVWLLVCLGLAYLPYIGRGFIADDYSWIFHSRATTVGDLRAPLVTTPMGFYRPVVSWSFAASYAAFGLWPMGYALTNFVLVATIGAGVAHLVRRGGFTAPVGLFGSALWMFNFHGIGMSLTWISGRTSLLTTLFAVLSAIAVSHGRAWLSGLATLAALLSKEEPVLLPAILCAWVMLDGKHASVTRALGRTWPSLAALLVYGILRHGTSALTPQTAPDYYRLSLSPSVLIPNALSYLDRSFTFPAAVLLLAWLLAVRRRLVLDPGERLWLLKGAIWFVLGSAVTMLVPVRSDLYVCFPSVGAAIMGAALGSALWRSLPPARRPRLLMAGLALLVALMPIYWARNARGRNDARLSARLLAATIERLDQHRDITRVEVFQQTGERPSAAAAVGGGLPHAVALVSGRSIDARVVGLPAGSDAPPSDAQVLRLIVRRGEVERR